MNARTSTHPAAAGDSSAASSDQKQSIKWDNMTSDHVTSVGSSSFYIRCHAGAESTVGLKSDADLHTQLPSNPQPRMMISPSELTPPPEENYRCNAKKMTQKSKPSLPIMYTTPCAHSRFQVQCSLLLA
ncbi:unnamed protein product [Spirodela intermedia]|uniref:Uncharacterized protein n=2 Tax=Spirodela intermedia TaxID=51605 RepID=A0A7I8IXF1_SPIIN|nr:unnamed protein product [Spirodela intermedia]CAA6662355.1 unnamed protein product [Spirodela intermedia]CAA7398755.1 unnamed protein product [Spirodela intermedia]